MSAKMLTGLWQIVANHRRQIIVSPNVGAARRKQTVVSSRTDAPVTGQGSLPEERIPDLQPELLPIVAELHSSGRL
jgi:hypothetical protein